MCCMFELSVGRSCCPGGGVKGGDKRKHLALDEERLTAWIKMKAEGKDHKNKEKSLDIGGDTQYSFIMDS